jgi:hypothetical protein
MKLILKQSKNGTNRNRPMMPESAQFTDAIDTNPPFSETLHCSTLNNIIEPLRAPKKGRKTSTIHPHSALIRTLVVSEKNP